MDLYDAYCQADPAFYDLPPATGEGSFLTALGREVPPGWQVSTRDVWTMLHPPGAALPAQGWKIHVSARPANARHVLERAWDHCVRRSLPFKFLSTPDTVVAQSTKYADRSGSGKFVTIYPAGEGDLARALAELGDELRGEEGPYILSDLRWEDGPLYVRYGGFVDRSCRDDAGEPVPAIEDPGGRLVPDERRATFTPPAWVTVPDCLAPALDRRNAPPPAPFPYEVREALHFSNGGGVYRATERATGRDVVLKEARPWAGLDGAGLDAVARLAHEQRILERLAGLDCVPAAGGRLRFWEHEFLVEELVAGSTVAEVMARRHPLISSEPAPEAVAGYTRWALGVLDGIERAVAAVHARGVVLADLHPRNVVVDDDGRVRLVDFELSHDAAEPWDRPLGAAGFVAPPDRTGFAVDRFALGCLRLYVFLPYTELLTWDPGKLDELIEAVEARFPVPAGFGAAVRADLAGGAPVGPAPRRVPADAGGAPVERGWRDDVWPRHGLPSWPRLRDSMVAAIHASATPGRADRLFPGDPAQFRPGGGLGLAHGAAGVLWALREVDAEPDPDHVDWLWVRAAAAARDGGLRPGLYDGAAGIALALDACGRRDEAAELAERALAGPLDPRDAGLFSGSAGIGLALLHLAGVTGEERFRERAAELARRGVALLDDPDRPAPSAGLARGWAGLALLLLRLHEGDGDPALVERAARAVRADLDRCVELDGTLQFDEGPRALPYLAVGSAGIGVVLSELLAVRPDGEGRTALEGIRRAATGDLVLQGGLFDGRAGLMVLLRSLRPVPAEAVWAHVRAMAWHAVPFGGHVAFVGDQLARLSMDLATGSAGVLLALGAVLGARPAGLPLLRPPPWAAAPPIPTTATGRR